MFFQFHLISHKYSQSIYYAVFFFFIIWCEYLLKFCESFVTVIRFGSSSISILLHFGRVQFKPFSLWCLVEKFKITFLVKSTLMFFNIHHVSVNFVYSLNKDLTHFSCLFIIIIAKRNLYNWTNKVYRTSTKF